VDGMRARAPASRFLGSIPNEERLRELFPFFE
jgi:hypothetical protein